jgi:hypothetical protein
MSIDDIQLPGYLCQIMYTNSLVNKLETDSIKPETIQKESIKKASNKLKINSLGENKKNILFLVNNSQNKFLADNEMKLLTDLLTACKISMEDIALVNYNQNLELNYQDLFDQFQSKKILIFGITASNLGLPFNIPFFQIQKFQEQLYMIGPSLSEFINNVELKKELWISLQKIFLLQK